MFHRTRLLLITLFVSLVAATAHSAATDSRPNILFCLADDWSWPHAGIYGDKVVSVPNFERIAREGVLFTHAFSAAPSCTPSRAAMLTGRAVHQLKEGASLWGFLPTEFECYPDLLERAGYVVGYCGKGWGPGNFKAGGRTRNPASNQFKSFAEFIKTVPPGKPFCFWFGSHDPHRAYAKGSGLKSGLKTNNVFVPPYWPDTPEVRSDILDYYFAVQRFDRDMGEVLKLIDEKELASNTLVAVSGDNGWPFPRCKANLYDGGTRQPLAIRWPDKVKAGKTIDAFVNLSDLAPTFLEAAGVKPQDGITGQSLLPLLQGKKQAGRDHVFVERERHANVRAGDLSYPARAIRTTDFLYIRNFRPDRWPAGDPQKWKAVGPFGDCDGSPTKQEILENREKPGMEKYFDLCFAKRPAEELYDLKNDPFQMHNVAGDPNYAKPQKKLSKELLEWMKKANDPRATTDDDRFDKYPYFGTNEGK